MTSSAQLLEEAHTSKLNALPDGPALTDYLLDAQEFLKTCDWEGYKSKFNLHTPETKKKSPPTRRETQQCKDCGGYIRECEGEATGICGECGTIAWQGIGNIHLEDHFSYEYLTRNKYKVHVYQRFVNFKDLLRRIQGLNKCLMPSEDRQKLALAIAALKPDVIDPTTITRALKTIGLLDKHRRHKETLAREFGGHKTVELTWTEFDTLCTMFVQVERAWEATKHKRRRDKRKVFMNYPFVFDQLCALAGFEHLRVVRQLKSDKLRGVQHAYWEKIKRFLEW